MPRRGGGAYRGEECGFYHQSLAIPSEGKEALCVLGGDVGDFADGYFINVCQSLRDQYKVGGFIALAAMRRGRQIGGVGFQDEGIKGNAGQRFVQSAVLKSENPAYS